MGDSTIQAQPDSVPKVAPSRLRLWPGLILIGALWATRLAASLGEFSPGRFFFSMVIMPIAVLAGIVLWTLFASRLRWSDRLVIVGAFAAAAVGTILIAGKNFPVLALVLYAVPVVTTVWVGWLLVTARLNWNMRRAGLILIFIVVGGICSLRRLDGMDGEFNAAFSWRWMTTSEQQLLSELKANSVNSTLELPVDATATTTVTENEEDWPAFRGRHRDGRLVGYKIKTNWDLSPPKELWRHRIGPGWSSFAIVGDRVYTQEQRGEDEYVVCYDALSGAEVWSHHDATRFMEVIAGAGPRATPTVEAGRLFALGANGRLNCLDAATGKLNWSQDLVADTKAAVPQWGFASSPLIAHGLVIVFAGAPEKKSVVAYRADTGKLAWTTGEGALSYGSAQLASIDGVDQVLMVTDVGLLAFDPEAGGELWRHSWLAKDIARVVQPALIGDRDVLIGTGMGLGTRRIRVEHNGNEWKTEEIWTSREIKPYYNDLVISGEHLYGFDGNIFMCVSTQDGSRKWRARGYGNGQVLLLADQSLLLVLTEQGEVALVEATPEKHVEIARFKAIEGKTWNHPVVCRGKLYVRNAEEIAAFMLATADTVKESDVAVDQTTEMPTEAE